MAISSELFTLDVELLRGAQKSHVYRIRGCTSETTLGEVMAEMFIKTGIPRSEQQYMNAAILKINQVPLGLQDHKDKVQHYAPYYFRRLYLIRISSSAKISC